MASTPIIGLYNHNGFLGSRIFQSLVPYHNKGTIKLVILHRPKSDVASLSTVDGIERRVIVVDEPTAKDEAANKAAVKGLNVVVSAAGIPGAAAQISLIKALAGSPDLWAYLPSQYGPLWTAEETSDPRLALLSARNALDVAAHQLGVPLTFVRAGGFVEWAFNDDHGPVSINVRTNTITGYTGWDKAPLYLVTVPYLGEAVAQLVATRLKSIADKSFYVVEYKSTGQEIADAFEKINGTPPKVHVMDHIEYEERLNGGLIKAVSAAVLKKWATSNWAYEGEEIPAQGYQSKSLVDIIREQK